MIQNSDVSSGFKIGTAAKMAGISPNTIRTWMRRDYFATSMATESGERILSSEDLKRLITLKSLIDLGDSIGRIARLDNEALNRRLAELKSNSESEFSNDIPSLANLEAAFVSPESSARLSSVSPLFWKSQNFKTVRELIEFASGENEISIALIDFQGRNPHEKDEILEFARLDPNVAVVVIFDFMQRGPLQELSKANIHLLRWPLNNIMIERYLYGILPSIGKQRNHQTSLEEPPQRAFTDRQLSVIGESHPAITCECPRHVSSVVSNLASFEEYCQQCLTTTPQDKKVHEYLYFETARARQIMEQALLRLCEEDGIQIPAP